MCEHSSVILLEHFMSVAVTNKTGCLVISFLHTVVCSCDALYIFNSCT
jgi:hypothetical protein